MRHHPAARTGIERRGVLGLGAAAGATTLLGACAGTSEAAESGSSSRQAMDRAELTALGLKGRVLLPGEPGYAEELKTYNLTVRHQPGVIVAAQAAADVSAAVRMAAKRSAPVGVLATGHQPAVPFGPDSVVVTTRAMRKVTVDARKRTARVEAGALWQQVVDEAAKVGLAPLNGSSPTVGVVGYTLGGGLSPTLGRAYGYAADHVRSVDVVTADGRTRTVTAHRDPELFFALLGGKGNFGIVTAMEFGLFPVRTLYAGPIMFDGGDAAKVLHAYRRWVTTVPNAMSSSVALLRLPDVPAVPQPLRGKLVTSVRVSYAGSAAKGAALVAPLRLAAKPLVDQVAEMPYAAFAAIHGDPVDPLPAYERTTLLKDLTAETVDAIVAAAGPTAAFPLTALEVRHLGGALRKAAAHATAVSHRDAAFNVFVAGIGGPADAAAIRAAEEAVIQRLRPWSTGGMLVNFMAADDATPESVRRAYDPRAYRRLTAVKRRVDPRNMFRLNHNILPG